MKNLPITANMQVADVVHINYQLLPVISRFGIKPGFGNSTISEACSDYGIDTTFFLEIINSFHNADYFSESQFGEYSPSLIVDYLKKTHDYYLNAKIPELEEIVNKFLHCSSNENKANNELIANFFGEYKSELKRHLQDEESSVFPYTLKLEQAHASGRATPDMIMVNNRHELDGHDHDHEHLGEKLFDLKNLIIRYLPRAGKYCLIEKLLVELFRLEEDLNDHARIEDKVLIPKIIQLEEKIKSDHVSA